MPLVLLKFHLNGPLTYLPAPAPLMAEVDVLEIVNKLDEVVVKRPLVNVNEPETETAPLKETPALLLMVRLLAPEIPSPVT